MRFGNLKCKCLIFRSGVLVSAEWEGGVVVDNPPRIAGIHLRRLAAGLGDLRARAGLNRQEVQAKTGINDATLYRIEEAQGRPQRRTLNTLLDLYRPEGHERERLLHLFEVSIKKGLRRPYHAELSEPYNTYISLEAEARALRVFQPTLIPGLLQIEDYTRALIEGLSPADHAATVDVQVRARMDRQAALARRNPLELWAILDDSALHRIVGSAEVMRRQLAHIRAAAQRPNVVVQVIPHHAGPHPGMLGSFLVMDFPAADEPEVVYLDTMAGQVFVEDKSEICSYVERFAALHTVALSPDHSVDHIASIEQQL